MDLFVPGRVCLLGEHSDWAGGYRRIDSGLTKGFCLVVGTDQGIHSKACAHPDKLIIRSALPDGKILGPYETDLAPESLLRIAEEGGFFSYSAGVAHHMLTNYHVGGIEIDNYRMTLPIRKGLSSSAANNVLLARAFNRIYDLKLTLRGEMEIAYQGEILTPSRCGRMDQACAYAETPVFLTFDGDRLDVEPIYPKENIYMVVADLRAGKNTQKILADLNACFPRTVGKIAEDVRYYLGPLNKDILSRGREILRAGDSRRLGMLMTESQRLFDLFVAPACSDELHSPKLHRILNDRKVQSLVYGGKGVGSQGDGSVQFVAHEKKEQNALIRLLRDMQLDPYPLTIKAKAESNDPNLD
ncbi:GHMP kinase [candidate division KSB1 bacterium]|nr:GHMP kinase [candidate division KSB1 bacterium]